MQHKWKQVKAKNGYVIAWECETCGACAGRHLADWSEDRPPERWLEITGIGEECKS